MFYRFFGFFVAILLFSTNVSAADESVDSEEVFEVPAIVITAEGVDADPAEDVNRKIYGFNKGIDEMFLEPVAKGYRKVVPAPIRERIGAALSNINEPVSFANSVLQGDVDNSFKTFWRFVINSTFGIGGLYNVASDFGLKARKEDFGQTLGKYGVGGGPYLMLPLLGPSNPRDLVGKVADTFTSPFTYAGTATTASINATDTVDTREGLIEKIDEVDETSFDPYATIRSAYIQKRNDLINNGDVSEEDNVEKDRQLTEKSE